MIFFVGTIECHLTGILAYSEPKAMNDFFEVLSSKFHAVKKKAAET